MGYGTTVSGAISGCATCCCVTLAKSQASSDHLHPLNAGIAAMYRQAQLRSLSGSRGFPRKMETTVIFTIV